MIFFIIAAALVVSACSDNESATRKKMISGNSKAKFSKDKVPNDKSSSESDKGPTEKSDASDASDAGNDDQSGDAGKNGGAKGDEGGSGKSGVEGKDGKDTIGADGGSGGKDGKDANSDGGGDSGKDGKDSKDGNTGKDGMDPKDGGAKDDGVLETDPPPEHSALSVTGTRADDDGAVITVTNAAGKSVEGRWPKKGETSTFDDICAGKTTKIKLTVKFRGRTSYPGDRRCFAGIRTAPSAVMVGHEADCDSTDFRDIDDRIATFSCPFSDLEIERLVLNPGIDINEWNN